MEESGKSRVVLPPREGKAPAEPNPCLPPLARNSFATPGLTAPLPEETPSFCLGKQKSTHFLSPGVVQITLVLKNKSSVDQDDRHFGPPFLLAVDELFANVRNLTLRHLPDGTLFPVEVSQYDPWVLREILHNCIAHQDYSMRGRINVVEVEDESILFTNLGQFLPGSVEEVIRRDQPQEEYRNRFLVDAMVNLHMIDTIGSGIRRSFGIQRDRNFPMPAYDLSEPGRVKVRVNASKRCH